LVHSALSLNPPNALADSFRLRSPSPETHLLGPAFGDQSRGCRGEGAVGAAARHGGLGRPRPACEALNAPAEFPVECRWFCALSPDTHVPAPSRTDAVKSFSCERVSHANKSSEATATLLPTRDDVILPYHSNPGNYMLHDKDIVRRVSEVLVTAPVRWGPAWKVLKHDHKTL